MIALLQRVTRADVRVEGRVVGEIGPGALALIGVRPEDGEAEADRLLERVLAYRMFGDPAGRMNLWLADVQGGLLLVPQFTLAADTSQGNRPGFSTAAPPETARSLFEHLAARASRLHTPVASGVFGAHMQVSLVNDGPVTFWLESGGGKARPINHQERS
jgi:D-tyrosyl-tRNA(Tyr) deacylase